MTVGMSALALTACGSGGKAASRAGAPTPVNLTVYVNDSRISVSPEVVGAGPVIFIVTNQASHSEALSISRGATSSHTLASTAPINPQGTTQVSVDFKPGDYTISTAAHGRTDAQLARASSIAPASLHIGRKRASSSAPLLSLTRSPQSAELWTWRRAGPSAAACGRRPSSAVRSVCPAGTPGLPEGATKWLLGAIVGRFACHTPARQRRGASRELSGRHPGRA